MRRLYQNHMSDSEGAQSIDKGGTGATTLAQGAKNLGLVTRDMVNKPNGVLLLNSLGALDKNALPGAVSNPSNPSLYGDNVVMVNQTLTLKITNYDSFVNYTVSAVGGTAVVKGEDVIFTAGSTAAAGSITLNGKSYGITVVTAPEAIVATPSITSPVNGTTSMAASVTVTSSAFSITNSTDTHLSSDWEISTDSSFATTFAQSLNDTVNKTSWTVSGLAALTKYYVRTRHKSSDDKLSGWSPISNFTTNSLYPSVEIQVVKPTVAETADEFSYALALSPDGKTLLAGAPYSDGTATNNGEAYVFESATGVFAQKAYLSSESPGTDYRLGVALALSADGTVAVVAESTNFPVETTGKGFGFYVYTKKTNGTWSRSSRVAVDTIANTDYFGASVSISGDGSTILVGSPGYNGSALVDYGAAYVFTLVSGAWSLQSTFFPDDVSVASNFGTSVALSSDGNMAFVGSMRENGTYTSQGAVYVFTRSGGTWSKTTKLTATGSSASDGLGRSLSLSTAADALVVGTLNGNAAYIFTRSGGTWSQQAKLISSDLAQNDYFGQAVAISGDGNTVLIGAWHKNGTYTNQGAAYIFTRNGTLWTERVKLMPALQETSAYFGYSVGLSSDGRLAAIGSHYALSAYSTNAAVHIFA